MHCAPMLGAQRQPNKDCSPSFLKCFLSAPSTPQKMKNGLEEQQTNTGVYLRVNKLRWHGLAKTTTHKPCGEVCVVWRVQI